LVKLIGYDIYGYHNYILIDNIDGRSWLWNSSMESSVWWTWVQL